MKDWLNAEFDDVPGAADDDDALKDFAPGGLGDAPFYGEEFEIDELEDDELEDEDLEDEDLEDDALAGAALTGATRGRDFDSIFAAAAAAVSQSAAAPLLEEIEEADTPQAVPPAPAPKAGQPRPAPLHASAVVAPPAPQPAGEALPPRPLTIRDKMLTFLNLPVFEEFASLATLYGELLALRYREVRLPADLQELVTRYPDTLHLVAVVTEGDPDTAAVLPIVARLVDASVRMDMRIVEDEDEDSLRPLALLLPDLDMTAALEEWDLPQIFIFDEEWEVQAQWGPRPTAADARVEAWLAANPAYETLASDESPAAVAAHAELTHTLLYEMRVWYNSDLNRACLDEWRDLLTGLLPADEPEAASER